MLGKNSVTNDTEFHIGLFAKFLHLHLVLPTTAGNQPASLAVLLGHELGHATGTLDDGETQMNNVNANENPVRKELGLPARTAYSVPKIIWKKGHIR